MGIVDFIQNNPGICFIVLGVIPILVTALVLCFTMDVGAAVVLKTQSFTSGYFWAWVASVAFVYFVGLFLTLSNTLENKYVFLYTLLLITFVLTHVAIFINLNQIQVS
jgi:hypothetical protein